MGHLGHGQLAHGVFRVLWVPTGEKDVLNVAHFDERSRKVGGTRERGLGCGVLVWCEVMMR